MLLELLAADKAMPHAAVQAGDVLTSSHCPASWQEKIISFHKKSEEGQVVQAHHVPPATAQINSVSTQPHIPTFSGRHGEDGEGSSPAPDLWATCRKVGTA